MYPVIGEPLLARGIGSSVILMDVLVTETIVGGFTGAWGKSDAITYMKSVCKLSPSSFDTDTLNLYKLNL